MQQTRKTLSLKPLAPVGDEATADVGHTLRTALALKVCVAAVYNRTAIRLAPHILYSRHDEPFVDGVVLERDGKPPRELKLGVFKLAGLGDVRLTSVPFEPSALFVAEEERYAGTTIQAVKRG